jgi:hypothetical protein
MNSAHTHNEPAQHPISDQLSPTTSQGTISVKELNRVQERHQCSPASNPSLHLNGRPSTH